MGQGSAVSTKAIWLVCLGIGLLFLIRGAFQPYIFPLFENLAGFSYAEIALLLNCYVLAQSLCARWPDGTRTGHLFAFPW